MKRFVNGLHQRDRIAFGYHSHIKLFRSWIDLAGIDVIHRRVQGGIGHGFGFELVVEAVRQVRGESTCQVQEVSTSLAVAGPGYAPGSAILFGKDA